MYSKAGLICYSSHKDLIEIIKKSIIRAGLPISYSKGFNPKPAISLYNPLPLGISSKCEVMVIHFDSLVRPEDLISSLNQTFPEGLKCIDAKYVKNKRSVKIETTQYTVDPGSNETLNDIDIENACIQRERNGKSIRLKGAVESYNPTEGKLCFSLFNTGEETVSPREFLQLCFEKERAAKMMFSTERCSINNESATNG